MDMSLNNRTRVSKAPMSGKGEIYCKKRQASSGWRKFLTGIFGGTTPSPTVARRPPKQLPKVTIVHSGYLKKKAPTFDHMKARRRPTPMLIKKGRPAVRPYYKDISIVPYYDYLEPDSGPNHIRALTKMWIEEQKKTQKKNDELRTEIKMRLNIIPCPKPKVPLGGLVKTVAIPEPVPKEMRIQPEPITNDKFHDYGLYTEGRVLVKMFRRVRRQGKRKRRQTIKREARRRGMGTAVPKENCHQKKVPEGVDERCRDTGLCSSFDLTPNPILAKKLGRQVREGTMPRRVRVREGSPPVPDLSARDFRSARATMLRNKTRVERIRHDRIPRDTYPGASISRKVRKEQRLEKRAQLRLDKKGEPKSDVPIKRRRPLFWRPLPPAPEVGGGGTNDVTEGVPCAIKPNVEPGCQVNVCKEIVPFYPAWSLTFPVASIDRTNDKTATPLELPRHDWQPGSRGGTLVQPTPLRFQCTKLIKNRLESKLDLHDPAFKGIFMITDNRNCLKGPVRAVSADFNMSSEYDEKVFVTPPVYIRDDGRLSNTKLGPVSSYRIRATASEQEAPRPPVTIEARPKTGPKAGAKTKVETESGAENKTGTGAAKIKTCSRAKTGEEIGADRTWYEDKLASTFEQMVTLIRENKALIETVIEAEGSVEHARAEIMILKGKLRDTDELLAKYDEIIDGVANLPTGPSETDSSVPVTIMDKCTSDSGLWSESLKTCRSMHTDSSVKRVTELLEKNFDLLKDHQNLLLRSIELGSRMLAFADSTHPRMVPCPPPTTNIPYPLMAGIKVGLEDRAANVLDILRNTFKAATRNVNIENVRAVFKAFINELMEYDDLIPSPTTTQPIKPGPSSLI